MCLFDLGVKLEKFRYALRLCHRKRTSKRPHLAEAKVHSGLAVFRFVCLILESTINSLFESSIPTWGLTKKFMCGSKFQTLLCLFDLRIKFNSFYTQTFVNNLTSNWPFLGPGVLETVWFGVPAWEMQKDISVVCIRNLKSKWPCCLGYSHIGLGVANDVKHRNLF